jgi:hypothetical protein
LCWNFLSTHRFYGKSKEFGYSYRFGPQVAISKGDPRTPHEDFGFLGSRRGYRGQIAMFLVSKEGYLCTQAHAAKK